MSSSVSSLSAKERRSKSLPAGKLLALRAVNGGEAHHHHHHHHHHQHHHDHHHNQQHSLPVPGEGSNGDSCSSIASSTTRSGNISVSRGSVNSSVGSATDAGAVLDGGEDVGCGKILLKFHYDSEWQAFTVKVLRAVNLQSCNDEEEISSYAVIQFVPKCHVLMKTKTKIFTNRPVWKEVFKFENFSKSNFEQHKAIRISVWDKTSVANDVKLGEAVVLLRHLGRRMSEMKEGLKVWKFLTLDSEQTDLSMGELQCSIEKASGDKYLLIHALKVVNACTTACSQDPNLYVELHFTDDDEHTSKQATKPVCNTFNPVYNHKFKLKVPDHCDLLDCSVKLLLKQQLTRRQENRRATMTTLDTVQYYTNTVGVIELSAQAQRHEMRTLWHSVADLKRGKISVSLKFQAPRRIDMLD